VASKKSSWIDALIGKRIRDRREQRGMSQESLGRPLAASAQQIQKYESGANRIAASNLFRLAYELGVPVTHFYKLVEEALPLPSGFSEDPADLRSPSDDKIAEIVRWLLREDARLDQAITFLNMREEDSS
jgi:transcriptional regulator with XRE-family HTH domain